MLNIRMKIHELVSARDTIRQGQLRTHEDFYSILDGLGWKKISNNAAYSSVFANPAKNYVIKLFEYTDLGYIKFLTLAVANRRQGNPHFPVLHGMPVRVTPNTMSVRLERLAPMTSYDDIRWWIRFMSDRDWERSIRYHPDSQAFLARWPKFMDALVALKKLAKSDSSIRFDLHSGNFMMRGDTPVITDPFAPA